MPTEKRRIQEREKQLKEAAKGEHICVELVTKKQTSRRDRDIAL